MRPLPTGPPLLLSLTGGLVPRVRRLPHGPLAAPRHALAERSGPPASAPSSTFLLPPRARVPLLRVARCPWPRSARARARGPLAGHPELLLLLEASPLEPDRAKPLGRSAFPAEQRPAAITAASPPGTPSQDPRGSLISIPRPPAPPIPQLRSREARAAHPRRAAPLLRHTEPLRRRRLATSVPPTPDPGPQHLRFGLRKLLESSAPTLDLAIDETRLIPPQVSKRRHQIFSPPATPEPP